MSALLDTRVDTPTTVKTVLRPIDREGLMAFAEKGRNNPASRGTNKVHTVADGQYRTLSYVGQHAPVVVDEPLHLFGQDTAPAPGEIALSGLGGCLAVGITAVATWKQVALSKLEIFLEGDIGNPAAWGAGGALKAPGEMGFQAIRVKVVIEGDAPREVLDEIVQQANTYSPVANTMRNPIPFEIALA
ncbi:MAG: OsmC family protein [Burkholderiales bacterium]